MSTHHPFVYFKTEAVLSIAGQALLVAQRPWTGILFKTRDGQLILSPLDALVDTGSAATTLPVQMADALQIPRPNTDDDGAATKIGGATGEGIGWIGPAEIAFPALGKDQLFKIQCCFNPYVKHPILGAPEIFRLFRFEKGQHPVSGESGYFLAPISTAVPQTQPLPSKDT
jgi:hypothetical protein